MNDLTAVIDRHLDAFANPDDEARLAAVRDLWAEDGALADPPITGEGHDGIAGVGGALVQQFPGHRFRRTTALDEHHGFVRYGWVLLDPDGTEVLAGEDIGVVGDDGRLQRIVGFFGPLVARAD